MEEPYSVPHSDGWTGTQIGILVIILVVTNAVTASVVFFAALPSSGPANPPSEHTVFITGVIDLTAAPENSTLSLGVEVDIKGTVELELKYEVKRCRDGEESLSLSFSANVTIESGIDYRILISTDDRTTPFDVVAAEDTFGFTVSFDPADEVWIAERTS